MLVVVQQLPKGPAQKSNKSLNPFNAYKAKYFQAGNESGAPIIHAIAVVFLAGYTIDVSLVSFSARFRRLPLYGILTGSAGPSRPSTVD